MTFMNVPIVDISACYSDDLAAKKNLAKTVNKICCDIGFLVIKGHRVPAALIEKTLNSLMLLFRKDLSHRLQSFKFG
jgi:isopenicillin N synthase-like dioxygenase